MTQEKGNLELDEQFQKCLVNKAFSIKALPTQPELLYTLTGGASLIHILQTLFVYLDADIQRMNETASLTSHQCIQRYARETLCPICVRSPSPWSLSNNYDDEIDEPLCENDCRYVVKTCFDQTSNPYVAFASAAQGYARVIKQIQEAAVELKVRRHWVLSPPKRTSFSHSSSNVSPKYTFISTIWWSMRRILEKPTWNCKLLVRVRIVNHSVRFNPYNQLLLNDVSSSVNGTVHCISCSVNFTALSVSWMLVWQNKWWAMSVRRPTMRQNPNDAHRSISILRGT